MTVEQVIWTVTIVIVLFSIGYFIWFGIYWNKMEKKKDEIMMRYHENQLEILRDMLSKKDDKDKM